MITARQVAFEAIYKMEKDKSYSNIVVDNSLGGLKEGRAFATALIYGVIERKITLDHIIKKYSKTPLNKLSPQVLVILRMSLYQLLYMDSVPSSAAVNEGVNLAKSNKVASASGFVNGVLRSFIRDNMEIPPVKGGMAEEISVKYSCPSWLVKQLTKEHGKEATQTILETSLSAPPTYLRVNNTKITAKDLIAKLSEEGIEAEETSLENCLNIKLSGDITKLSSYKKGLFHIQDMSSQICAKVATQNIENPSPRIADICAAPGGKSFTMAELLEGKGEIHSFDLHSSRVELIKEGASRLGLSNIIPQVADGSVKSGELGDFDRVLCDVPCSGFGIIRRKPEIKYKTSDEIKELPEIQYNILKNASGYVKAGGQVIYSTCTILQQENIKVVERFLQDNKDFDYYDKDNKYQTILPRVEGGDGFFICVLIKNIAN